MDRVKTEATSDSNANAAQAAKQESAPRVVVIDDHALLAESVVMTLRAAGLDASSVPFFSPDLVAAALQYRPDLVLLDLFRGDDIQPALTALTAFKSAGVPVLMVTASENRILHAQCIEAGAAGIIEKSAPIEALIDGVHRLLRNESVISQSRSVELLTELASFRHGSHQQSLIATLTPRERQVLQALTLGHPAGWIANEHSTSVVTVRTHIRSMLLKLNLHSQLEAVSMAHRQGWFR